MTFTISNVSEETIDQLRQKLLADHETVTPDKIGGFIIAGHGVSADAKYDESTKVLTVEIQKHPFFISQAHIQAALTDMVAQLQNTH